MRDSQSKIILPNQDELNLSTAGEIEQVFELQFMQYEGFVGNYEDSLLNRFVLRFQNPRDHSSITSRLCSDAEIEKARTLPISGLRFDKIPQESMPFEKVGDYIKEKYEGSSLRASTPQAPFVDRESILVSASGDEICRVQYAKVGIPGTFILFGK